MLAEEGSHGGIGVEVGVTGGVNCIVAKVDPQTQEFKYLGTGIASQWYILAFLDAEHLVETKAVELVLHLCPVVWPVREVALVKLNRCLYTVRAGPIAGVGPIFNYFFLPKLNPENSGKHVKVQTFDSNCQRKLADRCEGMYVIVTALVVFDGHFVHHHV